MKKIKLTLRNYSFVSFAMTSLCISPLVLAQDVPSTITPPTLGQETKGQPAYEERAPLPKEKTSTEKVPSSEVKTEQEDILGTASITESRRENGQVFEVEIDHSLGGKQYFEKDGSNGSLETTPKDLDDTPNLPKWKLGTW